MPAKTLGFLLSARVIPTRRCPGQMPALHSGGSPSLNAESLGLAIQEAALSLGFMSHRVTPLPEASCSPLKILSEVGPGSRGNSIVPAQAILPISQQPSCSPGPSLAQGWPYCHLLLTASSLPPSVPSYRNYITKTTQNAHNTKNFKTF